MSDTNNSDAPGGLPPGADITVDPTQVIQITFDPRTDQINLSGNALNSALLVYGMLGMAQEIYLRKRMGNSQDERRVVPAMFMPPGRA